MAPLLGPQRFGLQWQVNSREIQLTSLLEICRIVNPGERRGLGVMRGWVEALGRAHPTCLLTLPCLAAADLVHPSIGRWVGWVSLSTTEFICFSGFVLQLSPAPFSQSDMYQRSKM